MTENGGRSIQKGKRVLGAGTARRAVGSIEIVEKQKGKRSKSS